MRGHRILFLRRQETESKVKRNIGSQANFICGSVESSGLSIYPKSIGNALKS